jgi:hypothetical protein
MLMWSPFIAGWMWVEGHVVGGRAVRSCDRPRDAMCYLSSTLHYASIVLDAQIKPSPKPE